MTVSTIDGSSIVGRVVASNTARFGRHPWTPPFPSHPFERSAASQRAAKEVSQPERNENVLRNRAELKKGGGLFSITAFFQAWITVHRPFSICRRSGPNSPPSRSTSNSEME